MNDDAAHRQATLRMIADTLDELIPLCIRDIETGAISPSGFNASVAHIITENPLFSDTPPSPLRRIGILHELGHAPGGPSIKALRKAVLVELRDDTQRYYRSAQKAMAASGSLDPGLRGRRDRCMEALGRIAKCARSNDLWPERGEVFQRSVDQLETYFTGAIPFPVVSASA
jgi:hypothetical protein